MSQAAKLDAVIQCLREQRDAALDGIVTLRGQMAEKDETIRGLEESLAAAAKFQSTSNVVPLEQAAG